MKNKTFIVTGASSGIGRETALLLAKQGSKVIAIARREERLKELQNQNIIPLKLDVTGSLEALSDLLKKQPVHGLINNAGGALGKDLLVEAPDQKWQGMIESNVTGLVAITKLVLPYLEKSGEGDIVNVGSIAAFESYAGGSVYGAAKAFVLNFTKALRHEVLGKNIRVMGIHPGLVNTEFSLVRFDGDQKKADEVYKGLTPLSGRDVAEAIVWMLSAPRHVCVESMVLMPTDQATVWHTHRK